MLATAVGEDMVADLGEIEEAGGFGRVREHAAAVEGDVVSDASRGGYNAQCVLWKLARVRVHTVN